MLLGRLIKKERKAKGTIPGEIIEYFYNTTSANGKEQLETVKVNTKIKQQYAYDSWHRPIKYTEYIDDTAYVTQTVYKSDNSVDTIIYPNNVKINYVYSNLGYLQKVKMGGTILYETQSTNALNMPTAYKVSNGKITGGIGYDVWGTANSYTAYKTATPATKIQDLAMGFDAVTGNMMSRTDNTKSPAQSETFTYNTALEQLATATAGLLKDTTTYTDNKNGNILKRSGIGTYSYGAKIHAVTDINYTCGLLHAKDSFLNKVYYTPFNQPDSIVEQNMRVGVPGDQYFSTYFTYGPQYMRSKMVLKQGAAVKATRYYVGNYEKLVDSAGNTRHLVYIGGGRGLCAIASTIGSATTVYYVFTDHLGSLLKMTDSLGNTVGEQSFDAWGRERNPNDWTKDTVTRASGSPFESIYSLYGYGNNNGFITRGFTGHESLPQFNLINMNGRLYDPAIGRMLSPDNYVGDPTNTQSYNRYSYVLNNPLKYIDPSGWRNVDVWHEDVNAVNSDGHRGGGSGGVPNPFPKMSVGNWSSPFLMISAQYGTLAAMSAYANGTISAMQNWAISNMVTTSEVVDGYWHKNFSMRKNNMGSGNVFTWIPQHTETHFEFGTPNVADFMSGATAGIPAQYLSVGNGIGGAPTWVDKVENKINNFFSKYDKISFPALMIPEKVLYSAKTLSTYNSISKIQLPFNFLGLNVNPTTFYHSVSATNAIGNFGSYLSIGFSVKRLYKGQGSVGWNIMDGVVSFAATKNIYGAVFSTAYPGYKSIIQDIQNGNDLYENEVIKAFFIFPYPQKK